MSCAQVDSDPDMCLLPHGTAQPLCVETTTQVCPEMDSLSLLATLLKRLHAPVRLSHWILSMAGSITREEVAKHNKADDAWIIVDGDVFLAT